MHYLPPPILPPFGHKWDCSSSAAFLKDDEKRDWLVEPHYFTFGLTFMIAPMRNAALVLRSLKTIRKEAAIVAMILGRSAPDPGIGSPVELSGSDASGLLNLIRVGKALAGQRIATEKAPPALLPVEPARPRGNEDVMDGPTPFQPGASL